MTLREIFNAHAGLIEFEEARERRAWERARWQAFVILYPNLKPRDRPDLNFAWEGKLVEKVELTAEQIRILSEKLDRAGSVEQTPVSPADLQKAQWQQSAS